MSISYNDSLEVAQINCDCCPEEEELRDCSHYMDAVNHIKDVDTQWLSVYVNGEFFHACSGSCFKKLKARNKTQ